MPMMKSPFAQTLSSRKGHCLTFEADVAQWVPPEIVSEAIARGIVEAGEAAPLPEVVAPAETSDNEADGKEEFEAALDGALLRILTRSDPTDYKADGTPKVVKVIAEMSPDLRNPTATEVSDAFRKLQENIDLAE